MCNNKVIFPGRLIISRVNGVRGRVLMRNNDCDRALIKWHGGLGTSWMLVRFLICA